jgi:hypothetical protein
MKNPTLLILICLLISNYLYAQYLKGGEFTLRGGLDRAATIVLYSEESPILNVIIDWGDQTEDTLNSFYTEYIDSSDVFINYFSKVHYYDDFGEYIVNVQDSFLVDGINNIPNSGEGILSISDTISIIEGDGLFFNSPPVFQSLQTDLFYADGYIYHPLPIIEDDFDSLVLKTVSFPVHLNNSTPIEDSIICSTPYDCFLQFKPAAIGKYAVAIKSTEYRGAYRISTSTRAMIIEVDSLLSNTPNENFRLVNFLYSFPNPAKNLVNFNYQIECAPISASLKIYNVNGSLIESFALNRKEDVIVWDTSNHEGGIYIVRIESKEKMSSPLKLLIFKS